LLGVSCLSVGASSSTCGFDLLFALVLIIVVDVFFVLFCFFFQFRAAGTQHKGCLCLCLRAQPQAAINGKASGGSMVSNWRKTTPIFFSSMFFFPAGVEPAGEVCDVDEIRVEFC
ncbi:unnamed protein product, partial [Laminaria digitata]